jgi:hypothetical protein
MSKRERWLREEQIRNLGREIRARRVAAVNALKAKSLTLLE